MTVCAVCGEENLDRAKFCLECGAALASPARRVAEERKVVTALFCDLAGFTDSSEAADPEDVNEMLAAYSRMAREQIENHGGILEKFIGDAVVGVFGVPAAHEDDPERAVRAGLRIVETAEDLQGVDGEPLRVRVGINTGEALVRLGVSPESGEGFLRGDAINTASRIQTVAPVGGVAVGLPTYEATAPVFVYEELEAATLKGKARPVRVFRAIAPRARFGTDLTRTHSAPLIGREIDIALLKGVFDKTLASESVQLVTVVGEPGLGKSRLVAELFSYVDERSGLVIWRQGRCLPYGEGITFWALSEILKAHAGILESDPPAVAARKLDLVLPDGDERAWFRQRLLPLLGVETSSVAERGELFTAWRRWLEMVAEVNPTVLVFEDLHWADDAMLAFLDHLADRAEGVPLLIVGTARPEFFDRHPNYASGLRNANTVNLAPLSEPETTRLVSALLDVSVIPVELQQPILQLAGGNPLYAEEFVRLLRDRDLLVRTGSSWQRREGVELPLPDSIRSLIAARLDTLTADEKSQLADAAVVGKVFWAGAVAAMGQRDPGDLEEALRQLSRKELIRPVRRSSMQGQAEYAFWHILTRDVAYNQLPRASRASRHVAAATWIEAQAPDRTEDLAEVLAYHYATALDLAHATGQSEEADRLVRPARRFLLLAGERALGLDTQAALTNLERALALTPPSHPDRPEVLVRFGEAAQHSGRLAEAKDALEEAIPALRASGDLATTARAMGILGNASYYLGDPRWAELPAQACALLEPLPPSRALVNAVTEVARVEALLGSQDAAIASANRALTLAADLGLDPPPRALGYRGLARSDLGDTGGLEDMREAIRLATDAGQGREAAVIYGNLGESLAAFEGPAAALEVMRAGHALAQTRGITELVDFITPSTLDPLIACGELDEAIEVAAELAAAFGPADTLRLAITRAAQARICAMRGQAIEAAAWLEWLESTVRTAAATEYILVGLASSAMVRVALGQHDRATALLGEIDAVPNVCKTIFYSAWLPTLVRTALAVGERALAAALTTNYHPGTTYGAHALVAATAILDEARGDTPTAAASYADAARRWEQFGVIPETAYALQGYARCLIKLGRPDDATPALNRAHELLARLKATPALAETDALLEQAASLSPK